MTSALSEIGQIAVVVSDVSKVLPFYRDVLGLRFLFSAGPNLAFLQAGSVRLMLSPPEGGGHVGANSVLFFRVDDVEEHAEGDRRARRHQRHRSAAHRENARPRAVDRVRAGS